MTDFILQYSPVTQALIATLFTWGVTAAGAAVVFATNSVNQKLMDYPECSNADPYSAGWVMLLDPVELKSDLKELSFGVDSVKFIESEAERLLSMITDDPAAAAATGGEPLSDIYGSFRELGWDNLVKKII